jgi:hypothetical protein
VNGFLVRVLVDCDSSHNFISGNFLKCHDLPTSYITRVSVTIANERKSYTNQVFQDFELTSDYFNDNIAFTYIIPIQSDANMI